MLQNPAFHRVTNLPRRTSQQLGEGVGGLVQGGTASLLQLPQVCQMLPGGSVKIRTEMTGTAIGPPQRGGSGPVLSLPLPWVLQGILKLPPGQDHTLICRQLQCRVPWEIVPSPPRMGDTSAVEAGRLILGPQKDRQKCKIVVEDKPGRCAIPCAQRTAQAAVGRAETPFVLIRQPGGRRPHISEHIL